MMSSQDKLHVTLTDELSETTEFVGNITRVTLNGNELIQKSVKSAKVLIWLMGSMALILGLAALYIGCEVLSVLELFRECPVCGRTH